MKLSELERSGEIERLKVARKEMVNLIGSARTKLADARIEATSRETRLGLAYQCILTLGKAALRALEMAANDRSPLRLEFDYYIAQAQEETLR